MLDIGFILPSSKSNYKPFRNQPLVILYLMSILENHFGNKVNLSIIDLRGITKENLIYHIPEKDIYMYSIPTVDFKEITEIANELRIRYPKSKHIAGGSHPTLFLEECKKIFDSNVTGEGEESIIRVVNDFLANELKPVYGQEEKINLDNYPIPDRKWLPKTAVVDTGLLEGAYSSLPATIVVFSRGCPFSCHFCPNKFLTFGPVRFRSPELIEKEIEYLKSTYHIKALAFKDDNSIPVNAKIAAPILEAIGRTNVKWRGQSRANGISLETLKLAKESGCVDIALGIESASQEVLDTVNKKINLEKAKEYIKLLHKVDINVRLHFIIGLPNEPDDIVEKTLSFIDESNPKSVLLSYLCPMPGSEMFVNPGKFGMDIKTRNWDKYRLTAARFNEKEKPTFVFKYKDKNMMRISDNYLRLQAVLRERGLNF